MRQDKRKNNQLRKIDFIPNFVKNATGSVLSICGDTEVICTASIEQKIPSWMKHEGKKGGWLTAQYAMLPASTSTRNNRENKQGAGGRSSEIQRLIGRSLRAIVDLDKLDGFTVTIDCDVLNADGGTRCASINGAIMALELAFEKLKNEGDLVENPIKHEAGAISVGILEGQTLLDLCYVEDSAAETDMNVVMTLEKQFIEVQGTAEGMLFSKEQLDEALGFASLGIEQIIATRKKILQQSNNS